MHVGVAADVQVIGFTCELKGPDAGHRVHVRIKGPRPPPIGLTCAGVGPEQWCHGLWLSDGGCAQGADGCAVPSRVPLAERSDEAVAG